MMSPTDFLKGKHGRGPMRAKLTPMATEPRRDTAFGGRRSQIQPQIGADTPGWVGEKKTTVFLWLLLSLTL